LFSTGFAVEILELMILWPVHRFLAVLLAVFVTVGLSVSAAQTSDIGMKMSTGTEMTASGHCDHHPCDADHTGKAKAATCAAVCAPVLATLPQASSMAFAQMATILPLPNDELGRGTPPPPNRRPPRTF
jgi:hypothetical protein